MAESPGNGTPAPEMAPAPAEGPPRVDRAPEGAEERVGLRERVSAAIRSNRVSLFVLLPIAVIAAVVGIQSLDGDTPWVPASRVGQGSDVRADPNVGTTERYREALRKGEADRRDTAVASGESHIDAVHSERGDEPVVVGPVITGTQPPSAATAREPDPEPESDPLVDREYPEPRNVPAAVVRSEAAQGEPLALGPILDELIAVWDQEPKVQIVRYEPRNVVGEGDGTPVGDVQGTTGNPHGEAGVEPLVRAGRVVYAATLVGVDSELGLPVVVEVLEKPLDGAVLRGEFQQVRDRILIRFNRMSDPKRGVETGIEAYAVGLDCECGAVEGEVDRHWIARVVVPAAFGFTNSYLEAAAEPDVTVSVNGVVVTQRSEEESRRRVASGLAGAVRQAGQVIGESLPKGTTVRLPRGQDLGIVFVEPVLKEKGAAG